MKRMICLLTALMLCAMTVVPAFATNHGWIAPSIGEKEPPKVEDDIVIGGGSEGGEGGESGEGGEGGSGGSEESVGECVIITSIIQAVEKTTDISQEERDQLLNVYEELTSGDMELPLEDPTLVVRELVDISFVVEDCVDSDHGHEEEMEKENTVMTVTFNLGIRANASLEVMTLVGEEWVPANSVTINDNGTVTVELEHIGVVAFCMSPDEVLTPPDTGDIAMGDLLVWGGVMLTSGILLAVLLLKRREEAR